MPAFPDAGFNAVAPFYDRLAKLVFGDQLEKAQLATLPFIPENASVLVVGGGSGWILMQLLQQNHCREIVYLDASEKMLRLTEKKLQQVKPAQTKTELRLGTEKDLKPGETFDVIITNFLLDLFTEPRLQSLLTKLGKTLRPGGFWLVSDFRFIEVKQAWWQKALLKSMYLFFKLTCRINAGQLPDWNKALHQHGLIKIKSELFYNQMIEAAVYQDNVARKPL